MTPDDLLQKYTELRELREGVGVLSKAEATPRMRALAARFPGALRELDRLPTPLLEARFVALRGASPSVGCTFNAHFTRRSRKFFDDDGSKIHCLGAILGGKTAMKWLSEKRRLHSTSP
jgi:hypothetical protein